MIYCKGCTPRRIMYNLQKVYHILQEKKVYHTRFVLIVFILSGLELERLSSYRCPRHPKNRGRLVVYLYKVTSQTVFRLKCSQQRTQQPYDNPASQVFVLIYFFYELIKLKIGINPLGRVFVLVK
jgi:hypothetical protein